MIDAALLSYIVVCLLNEVVLKHTFSKCVAVWPLRRNFCFTFSMLLKTLNMNIECKNEKNKTPKHTIYYSKILCYATFFAYMSNNT